MTKNVKMLKTFLMESKIDNRPHFMEVYLMLSIRRFLMRELLVLLLNYFHFLFRHFLMDDYGANLLKIVSSNCSSSRASGVTIT